MTVVAAKQVGQGGEGLPEIRPHFCRSHAFALERAMVTSRVIGWIALEHGRSLVSAFGEVRERSRRRRNRRSSFRPIRTQRIVADLRVLRRELAREFATLADR